MPAVGRQGERDIRKRSACCGTTVGRKFTLSGAERRCGFRALKRPDCGRGAAVCHPSVEAVEARQKTSIGKSRAAGRNSSECDGSILTGGSLSALPNDGCKFLQGAAVPGYEP